MPKLVALLAAGWFVFLPAPCYAQADWSAVQQLPRGAQLRIELSEKVLQGKLREVTDATVAINGQTALRDNILLVQRVRTNKSKGAFRGFLIGMGVAVTHSILTTRSNTVPFALYLSAWYGGLGAAIGAAVMDPQVETIYRR
jgi:hypothetical protein